MPQSGTAPRTRLVHLQKLRKHNHPLIEMNESNLIAEFLLYVHSSFVTIMTYVGFAIFILIGLSKPDCDETTKENMDFHCASVFVLGSGKKS